MLKDTTLYLFSGSPPCWNVRVVLKENNLQRKEHRLKEVMLPAFKHGNHIINESYGVCLHMEINYPTFFQANM
uniref:GST N-terminal domain-containing protein n=1 Tax=Scleropages formosus TaxID=113540 RepID=A0A8C9V2E4_SCLFO